VSFTDADVTYPVTIEQTSSGLRLVVRRPAPKKPEKNSNRQVHGDRQEERTNSSSSLRVLRDLGGKSSSLDQLIAPAVGIARARGASDVFVSTGQGARIKIDGRLETIEVQIDDDALAVAVRELARDGSADLSLELDGARLRVNAFAHLGGAAIAARIIREHVPALGELGLPPELAAIVDHRDGLVLVCGPTGSGKSTTLASLIDLLDGKRAAHVITLEDPIEYRFAARRCLIHQRELGTHMQTFAEGLRAALREAPDVISLGELRDKDTIAAALTAAETGHLVLATLHAPNAVGAIDRLIDAGAPPGRLGACLRTVITQYLVPRKDGGRAVAAEVVPVTPAVGNIIRKGELQTLPTAIQSGRDGGMIPLERSLARLAETGAVAPAVIKKFAADHDLLASLAGKLR
jgi:twitching motility protein PilT